MYSKELLAKEKVLSQMHEDFSPVLQVLYHVATVQSNGFNPENCTSEEYIDHMDELDYMVTQKQTVIYNLFEWATTGTSGLIVVAISNTMDLPERLLPRVHSRLGIRRINFLPYSYEDISTIIHDRLGDLAAPLRPGRASLPGAADGGAQVRLLHQPLPALRPGPVRQSP